jgi:hypothetical protein
MIQFTALAHDSSYLDTLLDEDFETLEAAQQAVEAALKTAISPRGIIQSSDGREWHMEDFGDWRQIK